MFNHTNRKNKVVLTDYNYQRDIDSRLLIANLTAFEIEILREILNNSLTISLKQFAEHLNISLPELMLFIDKLKPSKLIKVVKENALIDKEVRKYYESHLIKFDEQFEPGMEFLQSLLIKVPLLASTAWYSLPRTSDDIFQSILEKFLASPKTYERYLQEIQFEDPKLNQIVKKIFSSFDYTVTAKELMNTCHLSHEKFEECMLVLEYNFVGCLQYRKVDGCWEEIVAPFFEWHELLRFKRDTTPKKILDVTNIQRSHSEDFGFVQDMSKILNALQIKPLAIEPFEGSYTLKPKEAAKLFPRSPTIYLKNLMDKLLINHMVEIDKERAYALEISLEWLQKSDQEKALTMSRHPIQVEKDLKRVLNLGWIYVEDFLKGFTGAFGLKETGSLKNKGKKWKYVLPSYTPQELEMIQTTLCERLFEAGVVAVGSLLEKPCICVTPFGKALLED
jgi:DNA-binding Lrp family transcriptional regulator